MIAPWVRWGLLLGAAIALVDTLTQLVLLAVGPVGNAAGLFLLLNLVLNVMLYALAGFLATNAEGAIRAGAEAAVLAGVLVGTWATVMGHALPAPETVAPPPPALAALQNLALNIALGGLSGLLGGWTARRTA
ncbi:MAG TPA: hypothetical protein VIN09_01480 [Chloroflexota bacterium]|jgi:hypothetical protein